MLEDIKVLQNDNASSN